MKKTPEQWNAWHVTHPRCLIGGFVGDCFAPPQAHHRDPFIHDDANGNLYPLCWQHHLNAFHKGQSYQRSWRKGRLMSAEVRESILEEAAKWCKLYPNAKKALPDHVLDELEVIETLAREEALERMGHHDERRAN